MRRAGRPLPRRQAYLQLSSSYDSSSNLSLYACNGAALVCVSKKLLSSTTSFVDHCAPIWQNMQTWARRTARKLHNFHCPMQRYDLIFNMFVMRRDFFNHYCEFLFSVLSEVERRLDISSYSKNDARVFGFLSERLLDVWLMTNQISYSETSLVFTEPTNWIKKGAGFLLRKFGFR